MNSPKICSLCKEVSDKFYLNEYAKDGRDVWCTPCRIEYSKERDKRICQDPELKMKLRSYNAAAQNRYYHRNKEKLKLKRMGYL